MGRQILDDTESNLRHTHVQPSTHRCPTFDTPSPTFDTPGPVFDTPVSNLRHTVSNFRLAVSNLRLSESDLRLAVITFCTQNRNSGNRNRGSGTNSGVFLFRAEDAENAQQTAEFKVIDRRYSVQTTRHHFALLYPSRLKNPPQCFVGVHVAVGNQSCCAVGNQSCCAVGNQSCCAVGNQSCCAIGCQPFCPKREQLCCDPQQGSTDAHDATSATTREISMGDGITPNSTRLRSRCESILSHAMRGRLGSLTIPCRISSGQPSCGCPVLRAVAGRRCRVRWSSGTRPWPFWGRRCSRGYCPARRKA